MITILFAWDVRAKDLIHSLCLIQEQTNSDIDRGSLRLVINDGRYVAVDIDCTVAELAGIDDILPASIVGYLDDEEGDE